MTLSRRTFAFASLTVPLGVALPTFTLPTFAAPASERALRAALSRIHAEAKSHAERLTRVSQLFIGKAFQLSPLGEGPDGDRDRDPIVSFERFDCVTYVEEVMALAWHADLDEAVARLQHIRYRGGVIDYGRRNHITMAQWIPENIAAGYLRDVTRDIAPKAARAARLVLTDASFTSEKGRALLLKKSERPLGVHALPILPLTALAAHAHELPHGSVLTTVRAAREHVPYRASHLGLVIARGAERYVRHAYQKSGKVIEDRIARFVARAKAPSSWPVTGFNVLRIAAAPP